MLKIQKKDTVLVIAGKDKGKKGEVKELIPSDDKVIVIGVNMISKHKKTSKSKPGGIHKLEAALHISNVQLVCPKCGKPTKVKVGAMPTGDKVRSCKKCGETII